MNCPKCNSNKVAGCPGGTCLRPSPWELEHIKYICTDCLYEFGDNGEDYLTIDEAVKELKGMMPIPEVKAQRELFRHEKAIQLGIEALEAYQELRGCTTIDVEGIKRLPSETG